MYIPIHILKITCAVSIFLCGNCLEAASFIAVTGNSENGEFRENSFYEVETKKGRARYIGSASVAPNQLAYDTLNGNYYYMDHGGSNFYRYDVNEGIEYLMGDLTAYGMPAGKTGSGGGDFYNGRYYYTPETGSSSIYVVSLTEDGRGISRQTPITPFNLGLINPLDDGSAGAGLGDFGDIAIDSASGFMYGSSSMGSGSELMTTFWRINLTDPQFEMTILNANVGSVYQLAFDDNGQLWGNSWQSGGVMVQLDPATGEIISQQNLQYREDGKGKWRDANGDFYDLASTGSRDGFPVIPEPSQTALISLALAALGCRRRR